jgi:hypothetical protein
VTKRDRTIVLVLGIAAVIGAFWFLAFSPRRAEVKKLNEQVATVQQERDAAVASASTARTAERGYSKDRAIVARLGKAVPSDDDSASLIYQLDSAAGLYHVDFHTLQLGGGAGGAPAAAPAAATQSATAALPPGAVVGTAGLSKLPFSLTFLGDYFGLEKFLHKMHAFTAVNGKGIRVDGRLLAVDGIALVPGPQGFPQIQANLTASAFVAPASTPEPAAPASAGAPAAPAASTPAPTAAAVVTGVGR